MLGERKNELIRKLVHTAGLLAIPILYYSEKLVIGIIAFFFILYPIIEIGLAKGFHIPILSQLTKDSKRPHEHRDGFAWPAYFVAIGDLFAIIFFPKNVAALAIFHVSLGDTVAALVGQQWGHKKLPFNSHKSWLGTFSYVVVTFIGGLFFLAPLPAFYIACIGATVEALPLHNLDNLLIPVVVSAATKLFFII